MKFQMQPKNLCVVAITLSLCGFGAFAARSQNPPDKIVVLEAPLTEIDNFPGLYVQLVNIAWEHNSRSARPQDKPELIADYYFNILPEEKTFSVHVRRKATSIGSVVQGGRRGRTVFINRKTLKVEKVEVNY